MQTSAGKYSYNYDAADEMLVQNAPTGSISYGYNANGSRILQQAGTARTTYQWDPRNRISSVTVPSGGRYTQLYRPDDMRLSESGPTGITTMIWSGRGGEGGSGGNGTMDVLGVVATQSGSPMQQVFAHSSGDSASGGAGIGLPLSLSPTPSLVRAMGSHADGAAINRGYHLDNQGGVQALTTATGSIEADYHTDSWGNVISGTAADNPYVYLGGLGYWEDSSLSLNYVRARWQETTTGSWLSVDSVRTEPRYQYAHNSPTRLVDASGRQSLSGAPIMPGGGLVQGAASALAGAAGWAGGVFVDASQANAADLRLGACIAGMGDLDTTERNLTGFQRPLWRAFVEQCAAYLERNDFVAREARGLRIVAAEIMDIIAPPVHETIVARGVDVDLDARASRITMPIMFDPARWNDARGKLPPDAQPFMPPHPLSPDGLRWAGGFTWGVYKSAVLAVDSIGSVIGHPITAIKAVYKALASKNIMELVVDCVKDQWHELRQKFTDLASARAVFEQGEAAGILTAEVVAIIVLVATSVTGISEIIDLIGASAKVIGDLVRIAIKDGLAAAAKELASRISGAVMKSIRNAQQALQQLRAKLKKKLLDLKAVGPEFIEPVNPYGMTLAEFDRGRAAYERAVRGLAAVANKLLSEGKSEEEVAKTVTSMRRSIGESYKNATPEPWRSLILARNLAKYEDELGPTLEYLRIKQNKSWRAIIESAAKPGGEDIILEIRQALRKAEEVE